MRSLLALTLFGGLALAASAPVRELTSQFPIGTGLAHFRGGRLFQLGPMVRAYAPDGTRDFDAPILTPNGKLAPVHDIAVDTDCSFAVAARGGIALLNQRGIQTGFIETGEFLPLNLTITEDHSIWVFGLNGKQDYDVLRKYSRDGTLQGSYLRRSTFPADRKPRWAFEGAEVMSSGNEVVLRAYGDLVHIDGDGRALWRKHLDDIPVQDFRDFAFTSDRRIYGCATTGGFQSSLIVFDLQSGTGKETKSPTPCLFSFFGSDEATLVFRKDKGDGMITVDWFQQPN
jgi:hypothetical protein